MLFARIQWQCTFFFVNGFIWERQHFSFNMHAEIEREIFRKYFCIFCWSFFSVSLSLSLPVFFPILFFVICFVSCFCRIGMVRFSVGFSIISCSQSGPVVQGTQKTIIINKKIRSFLAQIFSQITLHRC